MKLKITSVKRLKELAFLCVANCETNYKAENWYTMKMANAGNSGWSFGPIQFDISVSPYGREILEEIGVEPFLVEVLRTDTRQYPHENRLLIQAVRKVCNAMLHENMEYVCDKSTEYILKSIERLHKLKGTEHLEVDLVTILFLIDYHVQFHISKNGTCHRWLRETKVVTPQNFMAFKRSLPWNEKTEGKRDIERRYKCITDFCKSFGIWDEEKHGSPGQGESVQIDRKPDWINTDVKEDHSWIVI
jgi:hypothetical protein